MFVYQRSNDQMRSLVLFSAFSILDRIEYSETYLLSAYSLLRLSPHEWPLVCRFLFPFLRRHGFRAYRVVDSSMQQWHVRARVSGAAQCLKRADNRYAGTVLGG